MSDRNSLRNSLCLASLVVLLVTPAALAKDLRITDIGGTTVDLRGYINLDYTPSCCGFVQIDREDGGIRVLRGEAQVTVAWDRLKELRFDGINVELLTTTQGSPTTTVKFVGSPVLSGEVALGRYRIDLAKVRTIVVLADSKFESPDSAVYTDAIVTDAAGGTVTQVRGVWSIDMAIGEGTVAVRMSLLGELSVHRVDVGTAHGEIMLNDGKRSPALSRSGAELSGQTDLGSFKIRLSRVSKVTFSQRKK